MRSKKLLLALLSLLMMATAGVACSDTPNSDSSPSSSSESSSVQEMNVEITLDKTAISMHLFEKATLAARVRGTKDAVTWTSSNTNVVTVSAKGEIEPISVGTATITATVKGETATCSITVTPHQGNIEILVPYDTLEVKMGSTKNLSAVGCLGLINDVSGGVFSYKPNDESVVSVADDGTVTPLKVGETTIEITGSFKGVTAVGITVPVVVETFEQESLSATVPFYENRQSNLSIDLSDYDFTEIKTFEMDGKTYDFTINGKTLNVSKSQFVKMAGGEKNITITAITATGDMVIDGLVDYVNYAIGTEEEFKQFQLVYASKRGTAEDRKGIYTHVILTDNIDMFGADLNYWTTACNFYGSFDGQGYTIDDFSVTTNSMFYQIGDTRYDKTTVFKNVAFTNCVKGVENAGGVLAFIIENAVVENIYIQGNQIGAGSGNTPGYTGALSDYAQSGGTSKTVEIRNCFVQFESEGVKPMAGALVARVEESSVSVENCFAVSATAHGLYGVISNNEHGYDAVSKKANKNNFYTSLNDFVAEVKAVPFGFDIDVWEIRSGLLTFKSVNQSWDVVEVEGEQFAASNRAQALEIDLGAYNVQNAKVRNVLVGTNSVSNYTFENGKLTIASSELTARGHVDVVVTLKTATGKLTANAHAYIVDYAMGTAEEFAQFQLVYASKRGTSEDRNGIYTYAVLTDDIDMAGANFEYWTIACNFYGSFDGQGHTVKNFNLENSLLYKVGDTRYDQVTVFKNVGFTNCTRDAGTAGGVLACFLENAIIENVYIQCDQVGVGSGNTPGYTGALADYAHNNSTEKTVTIRNCLVQMESEGVKKMAGALVARAQEGYTTIENCYAVSSTAVGLYGQFAGTTDQGYDAITSKACTTNFYTSMDAFKTAVTSVPAGFNASYWEMKEDMLVFKSAYVKAINIDGEQLVAINRGQSLEIDLTAYDVANIDSVTVAGENVSNYTYESNKLTISASVLTKGRVGITLKAQTSVDEAIIKAQAYVVDYAIGSVKELNNFRDGYAGYDNTMPYLYVVLTDDIDYTDTETGEAGVYYEDGIATGTFFGSFDGQGHTISNIKVKNSFFVAINGIENGKRSEIKNFGLVNVIKHTGNGGGLLANDVLDTNIDNVYVSGVVEIYAGSTSGAIAGTTYRTSIKNCVAKITSSNTSLPALVTNANTSLSVENVYAVAQTNNANVKMYTNGTLAVDLNNHLYTSEDAFKDETSVMESVPTGFNQEYWSITEDGLVFNNAITVNA